jgi:hypothetical protein
MSAKRGNRKENELRSREGIWARMSSKSWNRDKYELKSREGV